MNQWITSKENQLPFYGLIELQIREGNYTAAQSMINTVPIDHNLSVAQKLEYDNFVLLKSHQMDVYGNGNTWAALSTNQEDDLVAIADNNEGWTGKQARHILNHYFGYHYPLTPPSVGGDSGTPANPYINQPGNQFSPYKQLVTATPNPASEDVFFDFRNLDYQKSNQLYIKDLSGNLIKTFTLEGDNGNVQWSTNNLPSGIYIYYIEINGTVEAIQKLVLIK